MIILKVAANLLNILKTTELYALKGLILQYVNYISNIFPKLKGTEKLSDKIQDPLMTEMHIHTYKLFSTPGRERILNLKRPFTKKPSANI